MTHILDSYEALKQRFPRYVRQALLNDWRKWLKGKKFVASVCDHVGQLKEYDCSCYNGCNTCFASIKCGSCNHCFSNHKTVVPAVRLLNKEINNAST